MNRREFLKGLFATGALVAANPTIAIEQFLTETSKMSDVDFVTYLKYTMQLFVMNPAQCAIITNIGVDDED
jgi:hypothetical protein